MASSFGHQSYSDGQRGGQNPLVSQDYQQEFVASLETPTHSSFCPTQQSPFLQPPADFACSSPEEEQQRVVIASNDLPVSDMDLANFLEMDDKALSGKDVIIIEVVLNLPLANVFGKNKYKSLEVFMGLRLVGH